MDLIPQIIISKTQEYIFINSSAHGINAKKKFVKLHFK